MARQSRSKAKGSGSAINFRLLIGGVLFLAIIGAIAFVVHDRHVRRNADALLARAHECSDRGEYADAQEWLGQYLQLRPEDHEARLLLAQWVDKSAASFAAKTRAIALYEKVIGFFPSRLELRIRKAELLLETDRLDEAVSEAAQPLTGSDGQRSTTPEVESKAKHVKALALYRRLQRSKTRTSVDEVVSALVAAIQANPGHSELAPALAQTYRDYADPPRPSEGDRVIDEMISASGASAPAYLARHRYRKNYKVPGADSDLQKALELAPNDVEVLLAHGDSQIAAKAHAAAIQTFRRLVESIAPTDRRGYVGLGRSYADLGDRAKAVEIWRQAIEKIGQDDIAFYLLVASTLINEARASPTRENREAVERSLSDARAVLRRLAGYVSENQHGRIVDSIDILEAEYWLGLGQPAKAAPQLARVAMSAWRGDNFQDDQVEAEQRWLLVGGCYAALQYWDLAADAYQHVADLKVHSGQAELDVAVALHNAGRLPQAIERYHRATQAQGAPAKAWLLLARAELQRQLRAKAHRDWAPYQRALKNAKQTLGTSAELLLVEAEATAAQGAPDEAARILAKAVEADPKRALSVAVLSYERWGFPQRADASVAALRKLEGKPGEADLIEAELFLRRKQPEAARQLLERAAATAQPSLASQLRARIADLELSLGRVDEARRRLREGHQAQPQDPRPLQRLGDLAVQAGDVQDLKFCEQELKAIEGDDSTLWRFYRGIRLLLEHPERGTKNSTTPDGSTAQVASVLADVKQLRDFLVRTRSNWPATHILSGVVAERENRLDEAASSYCRAADLGSQNLTLYERLFSLLYTQNRTEEAAQYLDRLQESLYSSTTLWSMERASLVHAGRFVELAERAEENAKFRKDKISQVWLGHARTLAAASEPESKRDHWYALAEEAFSEATSGEGQKDFRTWAGLVWYHMQRHHLDQARNALKGLKDHAELDATNRDLALAQGYHLIGDIPKAEEYYNNAVTRSPRDSAILERQARFYFATNPAKAQQAYEKLYAMDPSQTAHRFVLAALLASSGNEADFQKAMNLLSKEQGEPGKAAPVTNRRLQAILLMQRGEDRDDAEAGRLLRQLVEETTTPAPIDQLLLAQVYEREKKIPEAQRQYEYIVNVKSPVSAHLEAYLYFLLRQGMNVEFHRQMARLESLESEKDGLRVTRLRVHWLKQEKRTDELQLVIEEYRKAGLAQAKDGQQKTRVLLTAAALYDQLDLEPRAEKIYQELVEQRLVDHAYRPYALWLGQRARFAEAIRLCLKEGTADSSAAGAAVLANIVAAAMGRAEPPKKAQEMASADVTVAEQRINSAVQEHAQDRQLLFAVAALRHVQGRKAEAETFYRRLVDMHSSDVSVLNNLALILSEEPESHGQALEMIKQALEQAPQSLELRDSLGLVLLNVGQIDEANEVLNHLVARRKTNRRYLFHLAVAKYRLGDVEAARRNLAQAKTLSLSEEVLTPSERQLLSRLEADLAKPVPKKNS